MEPESSLPQSQEAATCPYPERVPVTTAWRVLGLRMEKRPPDMESSCEYVE